MNLIDWEIIYRKVNDRISKQEEQKLEDWLNASEEHRVYYNKVEKFYKKNHEPDVTIPNHIDEFMSKLDGKKRKLSINRFLRYAAVIALPLCCAIATYFMSDLNEFEQFVQYSQVETIEPIKNKAVLITSNGKSHELNADEIKAIKDEEGITIHKHLDSGLKYESQSQNENRKIAFNTLKTAKGGEYKLELADGTIVHLNCDSELRYPIDFIGGERRVELKGEAYFDVRKNGKPFIVDLGEMNVKVLGTRFNVKAYNEDESVLTTLVSGKVKVTTATDNQLESIELIPGEQAKWVRNSKELYSEMVDTDLYTSWIEGYFRFENQRMEDIMKNISRWYDVKIFYQSSDLKEKRLTGKLHRFDDFNVITGLIEKISGVEIEHNKNAVLIKNIE